MNIVIWALQAILGLLYLAGGYYKASQCETLASQFPAIPSGGWLVFGVVEMIGAVLLIVPAATKWMPALTPAAAVVLAIETLIISGVYAGQSLTLSGENPLLWSAVMLLLVAFVAYGRYAVAPLA
ncbi:DoxX family protein [Pseudenhygromyxa sp. WMMC2535]|uniref:DoxX family protein n=1 Tax=Pseudenhygromyxa sp. WMMC2535 TaxID=2712867 RepID=UPI0015549F7B|nr:DoxX family protein [Pseudenhygromyxa sp. WMMC2535]NVB38721.1 DoxX family protein [Pseudenhygromyxa sp. WMMC2535]